MKHASPRRFCSCCHKHCWPMWATIDHKTYCNNCAGVGGPAKPAECQRPLLTRIAEKVAEAITRDVRLTD